MPVLLRNLDSAKMKNIVVAGNALPEQLVRCKIDGIPSAFLKLHRHYLFLPIV